jgi:hypothetical protein
VGSSDVSGASMLTACEEVMSLHTIWLDHGMPGLLPLVGSQAGWASGVVFQPEQKPWISVSPELEEQGRVGLDLQLCSQA